MTQIQIISIIFSLSFLIFIFEIIRKKLLKEAYALIWVIMGVFFLGLSCWQKGLDWISKLFGIHYSPAFLFLVMMTALIMILIQYSIVISRQTDKIRSMAQAIALLKERLEKLESNDKET
jgi:hypothetical protein